MDDIEAITKNMFGDFIENEVNQKVLERDAAGIALSADIYDKACALGLIAHSLPADIGGKGCDALEWGKILEQVGYLSIDCGFPLVMSLRAGLINTLLRAGREDITQRFVLPMAQGKRAPAFAYTDGTDPFSFQTLAVRTDGGFILNGKKLYVTGGATADTFMLYARRNDQGYDDLNVFLVEKHDPGFTILPSDVAGLRSAGISNLVLKDVFVPEDRVLVSHDGLSHVQRFLNDRRVFLVCPLLGRMQAILETCIADLDTKLRYGNPLTSMQHTQARIGRMLQLVEVSRATVYRALEKQCSKNFDPYWDATSSIAKLTVVENAIEMVQIAQRLIGGDGYLREMHYERYLRDFCGFIPGGGSQETLTVDLGINAITLHDIKQKTKRLLASYSVSGSSQQGEKGSEQHNENIQTTVLV